MAGCGKALRASQTPASSYGRVMHELMAGSGMHYCIFDVGSTGFSISVYSLLVERLPRCPGLASGPRFRRTGNARSGSDRLPDAWHR
jgi:hypothetical protein